MMKLAPYPEYKDSGMPWLGKIPAHWDLRRAKYILRERDERWQEDKGNLLSVSQYTGVTKRRTREGSDDPDTRAESLIGYKVARTNDLVVNIMLAWNGSLGVSPTQGVVSPAYCVYKFQDGIPWYYHNLLRCTPYRAEIKRRSRGVVDSRLRLYSDGLFRLLLAKPSGDEQTQISRLLDWKTAQINKFIRNKLRLIELLKDQKQNVINQAVTRGLDPSVKLKPSGEEWIGDIPEHWEVRRVKHFCEKIVDCKNRTPPDGQENGYRVVRTSDVRGGKLINTEITWTTEEGYKLWTQRGAPKGGDVFFTREAPCGEACVVPENDDLCMGQRMMYLRPDSSLLDKEYLLFSIYGPVVRNYIAINTNGSTVGHLRLGQVFSLPIAWCPLEEQKAIVKYIRDISLTIDQAISRAESEIELMREYRTRLISDVVTGQVDVRGIDVPEVTEEELLALNEDAAESDDMINDEVVMEVEE